MEKLQLQELTLMSLSAEFLERGLERMMSRRDGFKKLKVLKITSSSPVRLSGKSLARVLNSVPSIERVHLSGLFTVPLFLREQYRKVCARKSERGGVTTEVFVDCSSVASEWSF